jgi:formyl-CoA transferase
MILNQVDSDGDQLLVPGIVPKLSRTPGNIHRVSPSIGQDNEQVLKEIGLSEEQISAMYARGIIWSEKKSHES